ncbi:MAG: SUMF1/EgtB/PvdO family nonheme iron enzyme [Ardenticatenaceae bacterium]|nr:SUMF1/EgtB/PvdO family nonheme iron enzyme [Ardenticatenaceae bacterium]
MTSAKDGMVMLYVPAGDFIMGSNKDDYLAKPDEFPQHQVYLDALWIDQTEVTNAMFAAFLNEAGNQQVDGKTWLNLRVTDPKIVQADGLWQPQAGYENHPVINVTWHGAQAYCEWAGRRLPTEAEWEKAARGTEGSLYPWGDDAPTCELTNYDGAECTLRHTMPVGSYPEGQSPYGALDMSGNVWEMVSDYYAADYYADSPGSNPTGPIEGESHVVRGSSFYVHQYDVRSARRGESLSTSSGSTVGFRCALLADD